MPSNADKHAPVLSILCCARRIHVVMRKFPLWPVAWPTFNPPLSVKPNLEAKTKPNPEDSYKFQFATRKLGKEIALSWSNLEPSQIKSSTATYLPSTCAANSAIHQLVAASERSIHRYKIRTGRITEDKAPNQFNNTPLAHQECRVLMAPSVPSIVSNAIANMPTAPHDLVIALQRPAGPSGHHTHTNLHLHIHM